MSFIPPPHTPIRKQVRQLLEGRRVLADEVALLRERVMAADPLNPLAWIDWPRVERLAAAAQARAAGGAAAGGSGGRTGGGAAAPLLGVFVSVKDLFQLRGAPIAAGTRARLPPLAEQSAVAERLEAAGAIVFAKANMHEIALGATGENGWTGDVCNPYDPARQAGGSSSGSAVAVACGIGAASIGSDTGGSVRIPAAFCGVVGFKPTFGAIPLDGALPLSWTCDHAGPITRCVDDAALLFDVLAGRGTGYGGGPADAVGGNRRPRLGVPRRWLEGRLAPAVR
ncbi:MAG: amidase, partial [Lautropia sp.]